MPLTPRQRILVAWLPAVAYTLLIWWLSSQAFELAFMERVPLRDKGVHFLEYGTLSFFIVHAYVVTWPRRGAMTLVHTVLCTMALGLLDELHQSFVPGRSPDVRDVLADCVGGFVGALAVSALFAARGEVAPDKADRPAAKSKSPS